MECTSSNFKTQAFTKEQLDKLVKELKPIQMCVYPEHLRELLENKLGIELGDDTTHARIRYVASKWVKDIYMMDNVDDMDFISYKV